MVAATGLQFRPEEPALRDLTRENVLMRTLMPCVVAVVAAVGLGFAVAEECAACEPKFDGTAIQADAVGIATGFSTDGQAVTLLFDNLLVDVGLRRGPLVKTRTLSVSVPIDSKDQEVTLVQDIRGYVDVDCGARAVLDVQAAGQTTVVDLQEAKERPGCCKPKPGKAACEARKRAMEEAEDFPEDDQQTGGFDFLQRIDGKLPAGMSYRVTFFLLVERDSDTADVGALLTVDSLDIEIGKPEKK